MVSWSLILAVASIHSLLPVARRYTRPFYELPYPDGEGQHVQGSDDALFVLGWLVLMTALRATIIEGVYQFGTWLRLMSHKACMRFAEQAFLLIYDGTSFSLGMVRTIHILAIHTLFVADEPSVSTYGVLLLAQFRRTLVYVAFTSDIRRVEVVLPRPTFFLASATARHPPREETKGLFSDVHSPHCNELPDVRRLHLPVDESRPCGSGYHGRGRLFAASK